MAGHTTIQAWQSEPGIKQSPTGLRLKQDCLKFTIPHVALANYDPLESFATRLFSQNLRFNADAMAQTVAAMLTSIGRQADERKLGMTFTLDRRSFHIREEWPRAREAAEIDKGDVGALLRWLRRSGFLSSSPRVIEAREWMARGEENSRAREAIRKVRRRTATLREETDVAAAKRRAAEVRRIVTAGNARIDQAVRATADCRDVATGWPVRWHKTSGSKTKVPIPVSNPHERSGTGWAATSYKDTGALFNYRLAAPKPMATTGFGADDRPKSRTDSVFDRTTVGRRHGIETGFSTPSRHGITSEGLTLHEAAMDADTIELPSAAQFDDVAPDDNDAANVVRLRQEKPSGQSYAAVMLKRTHKS